MLSRPWADEDEMERDMDAFCKHVNERYGDDTTVYIYPDEEEEEDDDDLD